MEIQMGTYEPRYEKTVIFCICKNKDADQLYAFTAWFVSDLVGNPDDRFSHNEAHMVNRMSSFLAKAGHSAT